MAHGVRADRGGVGVALGVVDRVGASVSWQNLLAAGLGGALISAAFLDFSLYPLAWIAFVPILWALGRARSLRESLWIGLVAGLLTNVPAFHWLVYTMHVFGGFPYVVAALFYLCLSAYSAAQFVLFAAGFWRVGFGSLGLAPALLWVGLEFLYPNLFPWRLANSQFHAPLLVQIGDVTGPFGLSFVMVWLGSAFTLVLDPPRTASVARRGLVSRILPLLTATAALVLVLGYGVARWPAVEAEIDSAPVVRVGLVQGNVGIREKGNFAFFDINVERYRKLSLSLQDDVDVLIWPESVAEWWVPTSARRLEEKDRPFPELQKTLVFGGLAYSYEGPGDGQRYNSAFLIDADGRVLGRYDKQVLLPFGEYLPGASIFPSLAELSPHTGDFTPGRGSVTLDVPNRVRFAPLVCYEDVPAGIAREMTRDGAEALLTIFNDAWFGRTMAPYQHEALALWRAVENRRYFVRVGNAGATGVIDPFGRVVGRLGLFTEETLAADIRPLRIETLYSRFGDVFAWSAVLAALALLAFRARKRGPAPCG